MRLPKNGHISIFKKKIILSNKVCKEKKNEKKKKKIYIYIYINNYFSVLNDFKNDTDIISSTIYGQ